MVPAIKRLAFEATRNANLTPQPLSSGAAQEDAPSAASGLGGIVRLAFASLTDNLDIWSLPITNRIKEKSRAN
jgi:hypothetical protein